MSAIFKVKTAHVNAPSPTKPKEVLTPNNFMSASAGSVTAPPLAADPTQFFKYAQCGKTDLVSTLLTKQLKKIDDRDNRGHTVLFHAVIKAQAQTSLTLRQQFHAKLNGADMHAIKEAYFAAVKEDKFAFVEFLIDQGFVDPRETDTQGHTAAFHIMKKATNASGEFLKKMKGKMVLNFRDNEVLAKSTGDCFERELTEPPKCRIIVRAPAPMPTNAQDREGLIKSPGKDMEPQHAAPLRRRIVVRPTPSAALNSSKAHTGCHYPYFY